MSQMVKNLSAMQETQPLISLWACAWPSTSRLGTDHGQAMMPLKWKAGKSVKSTLFSAPSPTFILHRIFDGDHSDQYKVILHWSFDLHLSNN